MDALTAEIRLVRPLPSPGGELAPYRNFRLALIDAAGTIFRLDSEDAAERVTFVAALPGVFFSDYQIEIPDADAAVLGLNSGEDAVVLVLVSGLGTPSGPTLNLRAPLVINRNNGNACQVILADDRWLSAAPLPEQRVAAEKLELAATA